MPYAPDKGSFWTEFPTGVWKVHVQNIELDTDGLDWRCGFIYYVQAGGNSTSDALFIVILPFVSYTELLEWQITNN